MTATNKISTALFACFAGIFILDACESYEAMKKLGADFDSFYSDNSRLIPIPATFIIDQDFTISFAKAAGGDYRNRVEASDILQALS